MTIFDVVSAEHIIEINYFVMKDSLPDLSVRVYKNLIVKEPIACGTILPWQQTCAFQIKSCDRTFGLDYVNLLPFPPVSSHLFWSTCKILC